jgi:hypothetical protein
MRDQTRHLLSAMMLGGFALAALASDAPKPPDTAVSVKTTEDPDALCAAAERVFLRRGWGLQSDTCATEARAVVSSGVAFKDLDLGADTNMTASFRVIVSSGRLEIATSCNRVSEGKVLPSEDCPATIGPKKDALVQEIVSESHSVAGGKRVRGGAGQPAPDAPPQTGCTKDVDCKGDRVCSRGECVDPSPGPAAGPDAG